MTSQEISLFLLSVVLYAIRLSLRRKSRIATVLPKAFVKRVSGCWGRSQDRSCGHRPDSVFLIYKALLVGVAFAACVVDKDLLENVLITALTL